MKQPEKELKAEARNASKWRASEGGFGDEGGGASVSMLSSVSSSPPRCHRKVAWSALAYVRLHMELRCGQLARMEA
jgi:hypothetical protein